MLAHKLTLQLADVWKRVASSWTMKSVNATLARQAHVISGWSVALIAALLNREFSPRVSVSANACLLRLFLVGGATPATGSEFSFGFNSSCNAVQSSSRVRVPTATSHL